MKTLRIIALSLSCIALAIAAPIFVMSQTIPHYVTLTWSWSGTGTATYNVYRATASGAENTPLVSGVTAMTYNDTSAVVGTKYYYTVTAVVGGIESGPSSEVSAQITVPPSPTNPATSVH